MNKSESKYYNTALLMDKALISLLEIKDLEYITVKEICEKAGVNRSTFYLHYESVEDLMNEVSEYINLQFLSYFTFDAQDFKNEIDKRDLKDLVFITPQFLRPYLSFVKGHKQIFRASLKNPKGMRAQKSFSALKKHVLEPILGRFGIPLNKRKYWINFYIQGTIAVIREWVMDDCKDSEETIEEVITHCILPNYSELEG